MRVHFYIEDPNYPQWADMTLEELEAEIARFEEESKNLTEWPPVI